MFSNLLLILIISACVFLGSLVYHNNPKGKDNRLFLLSIICVIIWIITNYLENINFSYIVRTYLLYADFLVALLMLYFWYLFCYNFLENKKLFNYFNLFILIYLIILIPLIFRNEIINNIFLKEG